LFEETLPPFSARNRSGQARVDDDCPQSTRIGLFYILRSLVARRYVDGWEALLEELRRIARVSPDAWNSVEPLLLSIEWEKVYDFCERLHSHLRQEVWVFNSVTEESELRVPLREVQKYIADELQRLFSEENLAFEFSGGIVRRRGRRHTADKVARAEVVLGDPRLSKARAHFDKALRYFRDVSQPDFENAVKEAVCAVEAAGRALFPKGGKTLGEVAKFLTGTDVGQLPPALAQSFHSLYGFRSGGTGVGHGGGTGGPATKEIAEYTLAMSASQIILLVDLEIASQPEVPF
jgi:hypothetical protein